MKRFTDILRIIVLVASGLAEIPVAYIMLFNPELNFKDGLTIELKQLAHAFSGGALAIGVLSILLLFFRTRATLMVGLSTLLIYHGMIGITEGILNYKGPQPMAIGFHGFLVMSLLFLLVQVVRQKE